MSRQTRCSPDQEPRRLPPRHRSMSPPWLCRLASLSAALVVSVALAGCGASGVAVEATPEDGVPAAGPCPPPDAADNAALDFVPFVVVDGVMFHSTFSPTVTVPESALGDVVATVRCRIADTVGNPEFLPREGDAAYLAAGTELREVVGYRTDFRLAAREEGAWRLYEPHEVPGAETGADLLDIGGKVERIHLVEGDRGEDVLRTVDDPAVVRRVVDAVLAAPVLADDTRFDRMGNEATMFVRFDLVDGTAVQRSWHVEAEVLAGHLEAPPALAETLAP